MPAHDGVAVVAVTRRGARLAGEIATALDSVTLYLPAKFLDQTDGPAMPFDVPLPRLVERLFGSCRGLVLVMAAGAAVRLIAPHLRSKDVDPGVVAVDDGGRFAIALLSGHLGGGNNLAHRIAAARGATPVITTASEGAGVPAADLIGMQFRWTVENPAGLKRLAAALVNGDAVGVWQDAGERDWASEPLPLHVHRYDNLADLLADAPEAAILISDRLLLPAADRPGWVRYRPRTLAIGIGCSRGATSDEIATLVDMTLTAHGLAAPSVRHVASIDVKAGEAGLLEFARQRGLPLRLYPAAELDAVPGCEHPSAVVEAAVGTRGVCEPAALLAAGARRLLVAKQKSARVTVAVARVEHDAGDR